MRRRLVAVAVFGALVAAAIVPGAPDPAGAAAGQTRPGDPVAIALAHMRGERAELGLSERDVDDLVVSDMVPTRHNGATHVYLQQRRHDLDVHGAITAVTVDRDGEVAHVGSRVVPGIERWTTDAPAPRLSDVEGIEAAAAAIGAEPTEPFQPRSEVVGAERSRTYSDGGISREAIPVRLVYQPMDDGSVRLAWEARIDVRDVESVWEVRVDATDGTELDRNNWVSHVEDPQRHDGGGHGHGPVVDVETAADDLLAHVGGGSYRVFAPPLEAPTFGARTLVADPAHPVASPFGWHDTDGAAGAEYTVTRGNNVYAYTDTDANDVPDPGSAPDGGAGLVFDNPLDLTQAPSTYRDAAVSNLFFWNNYAHDVFHRYGFDEVAGNFQVNNYGRGGLGNDPVLAEAQDGSGSNNANFTTPPDGSPGRMQMYIWTYTNPNRDSSLDNGVILHEYGHGVSIRMTGGPSTSACLSNQEQPGEGWSDFLGLILTMDPTGVEAPRGIGTYVLGHATNGPGIRPHRYSRDMVVNPFTYDSIKSLAVPHGTGSVFGTMLWDMTWDLIDVHGFDPDPLVMTSGNAIALQLVMDGFKMQPCSPGFVDARNAIIAADQLNNGGANLCTIWASFARRGLGHSASQGASTSVFDGAEAFDLPPQCRPLRLEKTAQAPTVPAGRAITYALSVTNQSDAPMDGVVVTDPVPAGTTYVAGSATCDGTFDGSTLVFALGTLAPGANQVCSFRARTAPEPYSSVVFEDDLESGDAGWTKTKAAGTWDWSRVTTDANSASHAMFASNPSAVSDQRLTTAQPITVPAQDSVLTFWHRYQTEAGYDGGVVELSTDGGTTWIDLGSRMTAHGYSGTLNVCCSNPLPGRGAFTGSRGWRQTSIDLADLAGQTVLVRFRFGSDNIIGSVGWWVDDVMLGNEVVVLNEATAAHLLGDLTSDSVTTRVLAPVAGATVADFDGDGTTDRAVWRPASGGWHVPGSLESYLGLSTDLAVPADYTGDGQTQRAVFRPSTGAWYVEGQAPQFFGIEGDIPVPADYDGDGIADIAVYRPSTGQWLIAGQEPTFFGIEGDIPVPADHDGDGIADIAVYRPGVGGWYVFGQIPVFHGLPGDLPVPADYDGDGVADIAVWRPAVGGWYVLGLPTEFIGLSSDTPQPGDYDGDGVADRAVFRPQFGGWYVEGEADQYHGLPSDIPLVLPHAIARFR